MDVKAAVPELPGAEPGARLGWHPSLYATIHESCSIMRSYVGTARACLEMRLLGAPQRRHSGSSSSASAAAAWERAISAATSTSLCATENTVDAGSKLSFHLHLSLDNRRSGCMCSGFNHAAA